MKNDLMQKVGELLDLAVLDQEVIKSVTEKLADENVVLEGEEEMQEEKVEEAACPIKHEEPEKEAEDETTAPVDPKTNVGGYNAVTEEEFQQIMADFEALKEEYAKLVAEKVIEESEIEEAEEVEEEVEGEEPSEIEEALSVLLSLVQEAYEQTAQMKADFDVLKEEYAKMIAEKVIEEGCDDEVALEKGEEEDKAENAKEDEEKKESEAQEDEEKADIDKAEGKEEEAEKEEKKAKKHKAEEAEDKAEEDKDYEKAHESLEETAEKIAEEVTAITEEAAAPTVKIAKAYTAFTQISESEEGKKERKAFTLFPNL